MDGGCGRFLRADAAVLRSIRDSVALVERAEWVSLAMLVMVHVSTALLETTGAGVVFIFFKVAMDLDTFGGIEMVRRVYRGLGFADRATFMALFTLTVLAVFLARTAFLAWSAWLNLAVSRRIQRRVANRLFRGYIRDSYVRHLSKRSAVVMNNVTGNAAGAVVHCTLGLVEITSASLLMLFFVAGLFYVKPQETVVTCVVLGGMSGAYWMVMHERLSRWGHRMIEAVQEVYRAVTEAFSGFKTIKVMGIEREFEESFEKLIREQTKLTIKSSFAQQTPRLALEMVLVTGVLGLAAGAFAAGQAATELVPTLALFGVAALRIMPAFGRVVTALQLYKGALPALAAILPDYRRFADTDGTVRPRTAAAGRPEFRERINLEGVSFAYDAMSQPAIVDVTLEIGKGQFVGFAGPSGSGKTTTVDVILGLLAPDVGVVRIDGVERESDAQWTHRVFGYVPQDPFVVDDTLRRNIALGVTRGEIDEARLARAVKQSALEAVVAKMPDGLDTVLGEHGGRLSGGERQRLGLARALYIDAEILVLDEPTSALDATTEAEVSKVIDALRGEKTIIMIAHRLSTIVRCDQIFYFEKGRLVATGTFEQLLASCGGFRRMVEHLRIKNGIGDRAAASA